MAASSTEPKSARRKTTLRLPDDVYETAREGAALGLAESESAFIADAVRRRAREVRHARMRRLADEAMADPGFVADMRETMAAFGPLDSQDWPASEIDAP